MFHAVIVMTATMHLESVLMLGCIRTLVTFEGLGVGMCYHVSLVSGDAQPEMADGTLPSAFLVGL